MKKTEAEQIAVWRLHVEIVNTIRATLPTILRYASFGSHVQKKLAAALPGYSVRCDVQYGSYKIQVWSNSANGLSYEDSPYIAWMIPQDGTEWFNGLHDALNRANPSDTLERYEAEEAILPHLAWLDAEIALCKEQAQSMIADLGVPPTAQKTGMRAEPMHWDDLSHIRRERFPNLFPKTR